MSALQPELLGPEPRMRAAGRPKRRVAELLRSGSAATAAAAVALAVTLAMPKPNYLLVLGVLGVLLGVIALVNYPRLEVSVGLLGLYVGVIEGPVKLLVYNQAVSAVRDVLVAAIAIGALARLWASGQRLRLPPLSGWVMAFTALVVAQAFNPSTEGVVKSIGGFRQQLDWVPLFFFGYALMRTRGRLRKMFVILGVIALANGLVSLYQTKVGTGGLASWGPGYSELVHGSEGITGRQYVSEGVAYVRPPGLGADIGFPGSVGVMALTGSLALLATARRRRRWVALLFCLGAILAVAMGLSRLTAVGGVLAVAVFALLSLSAGRRVTRPLAALGAVALFALPLGALLIASEGHGVFSRYESIAPTKVVGTSTSYKEVSLAEVVQVVVSDPFGFGLGTAGAASAFGGHTKASLEGHHFSAETQPNFIVDELGLPGLVLWYTIALLVCFLAVRGLPRVADVEVRILLAGVFSAFIAYLVMGFDGPVTAGAAFGAYFWFAMGIAAYWFVPARGRALGRLTPVAR